VIPNGAIGARFSADGRTLYLTDVTGLAVYDVADPESPQIRSHLPLPRCGGSGVYLVDVSDPGDPTILDARPSRAPGLTVYDVRDLSAAPVATSAGGEELAWVTGADETFAFDLTDPASPRLVLGGPGEPGPEHGRLLWALTPQARATGWPDHGAPVGFYVSAGSAWGAYLAPSDCPPLGSRGRDAERVTLSPIGELGRSASWGRGPAPSPPALA
jgi:hypothetical protein